MPLFLRERDTEATELMDRSDCDPEMLQNTYRHFSVINRFLSGWDKLFKQYIAPACTDSSKTYTLLDIGFGGGDIAIRLDQLARKNGIRLKITAIDTDERALAYARQLGTPDSISFRCISEEILISEGHSYDFVVSNHLLHHLDIQDLHVLLENCRQLTNHKLLFYDLRRSDAAWILFNLLTSVSFRKSFIRADGLTSIRRSYTSDELSKLLPDDYVALPKSPFRLLVTNKPEGKL